jgi:hypothetical protein
VNVKRGSFRVVFNHKVIDHIGNGHIPSITVARVSVRINSMIAHIIIYKWEVSRDKIQVVRRRWI